MRISHLQAIADILLGDAKTLARGYDEIMTDSGADFETADARRRCAIAVNAVGMAVATDGYRSALTALAARPRVEPKRSEEHTSELQSLMRISYAVFCLKKKMPHAATHLKTSLTNSIQQSPHHQTP